MMILIKSNLQRNIQGIVAIIILESRVIAIAATAIVDMVEEIVIRMTIKMVVLVVEM